MSDCKKYYTVKELALELGVHSNTIYRSIKSGKIFAIKLGGAISDTYRIPKSELQKMTGEENE